MPLGTTETLNALTPLKPAGVVVDDS